MHIALYQPDIPQNLGSILRLCACLGVTCHVIEPCGFPVDDKKVRRAGMDYMEFVDWKRHASWEVFQAYRTQAGLRLILLTTKTNQPYTGVTYNDNDVVLMGRESAGVPAEVAEACELRVTIPMKGKARSLNVALASAIVLGEAARQLAIC
jgi:tRNA (cytidine/uridine-2'-O-)-methyltransferase